jgi:hypothetical protein
MIRGRIANLYIQKSGRPDDEIEIFTSNVPGMYKVVYIPNDSASKSKYSFFMSQERVLDYIANVLRTLSTDVEPFDYIQLQSMTAPSVLYNIADLEDRELRMLIIESIRYALEAHPTKNETS